MPGTSIHNFAESVRRHFPQSDYKRYDDFDLTSAIVQKYPQYIRQLDQEEWRKAIREKSGELPEYERNEFINERGVNWKEFPIFGYTSGPGVVRGAKGVGRGLKSVFYDFPKDVVRAFGEEPSLEEIGVEAGGGRSTLALKRLLADPSIRRYQQLKKGIESREITSPLDILGQSATIATGPIGEMISGLSERAASDPEGAAGEALVYLAGPKVLKEVRGRIGRGPTPVTPRQRMASLTYALGGEREAGPALERALPDLEATVRRTGGEPTTPPEFLKNVQDTRRQLKSIYAQNLQQVAGELNVPLKVSDALKAKADSLPEIAKAEAADLRDLATNYEKPRTVRDMDRERIWRNARADAFYDKDAAAQMAAQAKAVPAAVDKLIADTLRDIIYEDVMEKRFPNMRDLKLREGALIELEKVLKKRVPDLFSTQLEAEGRPMRERISFTAYAGGHGVRPLVHGGGKLFPRWRGPEVTASSAIRKAYRGLGRRDLVKEAANLRSQGKGALADVLDKESQATTNEKARAIIKEIKTPEDEMERARRQGTIPPVSGARGPSASYTPPRPGFGTSKEGIEAIPPDKLKQAYDEWKAENPNKPLDIDDIFRRARGGK